MASQRSGKAYNFRQSNQHQHHKIVHFEPFKLFSDDNKSLRETIELIENASLNRFRLFVVSFVGKNSLDKTIENSLIESLLSDARELNKKNIRSKTIEGQSKSTPVTTCEEDEFETQIYGQIDSKSDIIVMKLDSFLDAEKLCKLSENLGSISNDESATSSFTNVWPGWNQNLIKTMLILFLMSHTIVFYNPEPNIDYALIQTLKIIDMLRLKAQTRMTDLLETIASKQMFSQQWVRQARLTTPRALFVCQTFNCSELVELKIIKRDIEDQIYKLLKKANIIGQITGSNLLNLPEQGDFVYLITKQHTTSKLSIRKDERYLLNCENFYAKLFKSLEIDNDKTKVSDNNERHHHDDDDDDDEDEEKASNEQQEEPKPANWQNTQIGFRKFVMKHINEMQAIANQTDHQEQKNKSSILLPRYDDYFNVLLKLKYLLFPRQLVDESIEKNLIDWKSPDERRFVDIYDLNNHDELFSKRHCYKTRLAAFDYYVRNMQAQNQNLVAHTSSLESAKSLYLNHARGSANLINLDLLIEQCNLYWDNQSRSLAEDCHKGKGGGGGGGGNRISRTVSSNADIASSNRASNNPRTSSGKSTFSLLRRSNGLKLSTVCICNRQNNYLITTSDKSKKLERLDIRCLD